MTTTDQPGDRRPRTHMRRALCAGARAGLGRVWPNPAVGCVIVDAAGHVVGRGWTQPGGRPHAETEALREAGERAQGRHRLCHAGTLRPSRPDAALRRRADRRRHRARASARSRIPIRASSGQRASPRCARPASRSRSACWPRRRGELNAGFLKRVDRAGRWSTLKLATIARRPDRDPEPARASGSPARRRAPRASAARHARRDHGRRRHRPRRRSGADLPPAGPGATARRSGWCSIGAGGARRSAKLAGDARPTWLVTAPGMLRRSRFETPHEVIEIDEHGGRAGWTAAVPAQALAQRGLTRVLVEGGADAGHGLPGGRPGRPPLLVPGADA